MSLGILEIADVIEKMQNFIDRKRPDEEIRHLVDLSYRIEGQSIVIFEIRPLMLRPDEMIEQPIAKTTYVKAKDHWKVFWMRASGWYPFRPESVKTLDQFIELVEHDNTGCFWG